ncbi:hypothetical protein [Streptomyces hydrogenans]|uniref:hypothetical protein n=1 Tax=Streptomyces hydrogenans TaxID=1873719 RepID=UPI0037FA1C62
MSSYATRAGWTALAQQAAGLLLNTGARWLHDHRTTRRPTPAAAPAGTPTAPAPPTTAGPVAAQDLLQLTADTGIRWLRENPRPRWTQLFLQAGVQIVVVLAAMVAAGFERYLR